MLFRDYGIYDMAEIRLAEQKGHKISDNFYVRKDGTRAYYFSEQVLRQIFQEAGFEAEEVKMHRCVSVPASVCVYGEGVVGPIGLYVS